MATINGNNHIKLSWKEVRVESTLLILPMWKPEAPPRKEIPFMALPTINTSSSTSWKFLELFKALAARNTLVDPYFG